MFCGVGDIVEEAFDEIRSHWIATINSLVDDIELQSLHGTNHEFEATASPFVLRNSVCVVLLRPVDDYLVAVRDEACARWFDVVLPDSSIGFYAADDFVNGEVAGVRKILIVELKRGGFCVTQKEADQAREYARELRAKGCAQETTDIEAYVLGAFVEQGLEKMTQGRTTIIPTPYDVILNRAHARTFNLQKRIAESKPEIKPDREIAEVLEQALDFEAGGS